MTAITRLLIWSFAGWLAGTIGSRFFLTPAPAGANNITLPAAAEKLISVSVGENAGLEWRALLDERKANVFPVLTTQELTHLLTASIPQGSQAQLNLMRALAALPAKELPLLLPVVADGNNGALVEVFFAAWARHDPAAALAGLKRMSSARLPAMDGILQSWAEKDPAGLLKWARSPGIRGAAKIQAARKVFPLLAERDPVQALELARGLARPEDLQDIFRIWYRRDPAAADQWMTDISSDTRESIFDACIMARLDQDPATAWQQTLAHHPDSTTMPELLSAIFVSWGARDSRAAQAALEQIPVNLWTPELATAMGEKMGRGQTPALESFATRFPNESVRGAFWNGVLESFSSSDGNPAYAAAAFDRMPAGINGREKYAEKITGAWVAQDPAAASAWILKLPRDSARDHAAAILAETLRKSDPEAAIAWASDIKDSAIRETTLESVIPP